MSHRRYHPEANHCGLLLGPIPKISAVACEYPLKHDIIFERHANLKYKYSNRTFLRRGFYVSTVGNNKSAEYNCVANQLKEDMQTDQITIKEYKGPFKE